MEHTDDLTTITQECADRITSNIGYKEYIVDELYNLQIDIRNKIRERLSEAFDEFVEDVDYFDSKEDLKNNLFKIIKDL